MSFTDVFVISIIATYSSALLIIFLYSLMQAHLVYLYIKSKRTKNIAASVMEDEKLPHVTIQLPIFNELYVVERLINCIAQIDYPTHLLQIQALDDSTDETRALIAKKVAEWQRKEIDIQHVRRENREGFKAGALSYGLQTAKGDFIAIFDADFLPPADFLRKTIPAFADERTGVVQTGWSHLNENYSLLTRLQAFALNAHFSVEQGGRNAGNHFINFNGTAGVWRKKCIIDAGGWHSDTLTEDLDLSYRAQLKGWKFIFMEFLSCPAELPIAINALKTQQFRWTKGAAECARKNLSSVIRSANLSLTTKIHACFHLMNSSIFICAIVLAILSIPILLIKVHYIQFDLWFQMGLFFMSSFIILTFFYWVSFSSKRTESKPKNLAAFFVKFPLFLSLAMGLSLHNAIAVVEGYIGKKTPFIRTPKFNIDSKNGEWKSNKYLSGGLNFISISEGFLTLYFIGGIFLSFWFGEYGLLPFHLLLTIGFGCLFAYSFLHSKSSM